MRVGAYSGDYGSYMCTCTIKYVVQAMAIPLTLALNRRRWAYNTYFHATRCCICPSIVHANITIIILLGECRALRASVSKLNVQCSVLCSV